MKLRSQIPAVPLLLFDPADERELTAAIRQGTHSSVVTVIRRLTQKLSHSKLPPEQCHLFFSELMICLLRLTREAGVEIPAVFGPRFTGSLQITDFPSPREVGSWFLDCSLRLWEFISRQRSDSTWRTVEKAKAFISTHYSDPELRVETLCEYLHLSPAYFSTLFKRETGASFTGYVTMVRMEQAAHLLHHTDTKSYLVARQVGYDDPNYFSSVFKKYFGISPTQFRFSGNAASQPSPSKNRRSLV